MVPRRSAVTGGTWVPFRPGGEILEIFHRGGFVRLRYLRDRKATIYPRFFLGCVLDSNRGVDSKRGLTIDCFDLLRCRTIIRGADEQSARSRDQVAGTHPSGKAPAY